MRLFGCVGCESVHSHNIRELVKEECFVIILGYDFFLFLHKKNVCNGVFIARYQALLQSKSANIFLNSP